MKLDLFVDPRSSFVLIRDPPTDDDLLDDRDEKRSARHAAVLEELAEIGMDLVRELRGQGLEAADAALAYSRLSRAIRLTLALEDRLADGWDERRRAAEAERAAAPAAADNELARRSINALINCDSVREQVEDAIETATGGRETDSLIRGLYARLREFDEDDFADLEPFQIAARICKDLGAPFDAALWDDDPEPLRWAAASRRRKTGPRPASPNPPATANPPASDRPSANPLSRGERAGPAPKAWEGEGVRRRPIGFTAPGVRI